MKASLKKFKESALVSSDSKNEVKFDSVLVVKMKDILVAKDGRAQKTLEGGETEILRDQGRVS